MIKSPVFLAVILLMSTLIAMGYQAVDLNKVRQKKIYAVGQAPEPTKPKQSTTKVTTLKDLAKQNLMGIPAKKGVGKSAGENAAKVAALKFTLSGTIIKTGGGKSSAFIIQGGNHESHRYYVGDSIENGVILDSVAANSVVLKRNGKLETLNYPVNVATNNPAPPAPPTAPMANLPMTAAPPRPNRPGSNETPAANRPLNNLHERLKNLRVNPNVQPNPAGQQPGKH